MEDNGESGGESSRAILARARGLPEYRVAMASKVKGRDICGCCSGHWAMGVVAVDGPKEVWALVGYVGDGNGKN